MDARTESQQDFAARLQRIAANSAGEQQLVYVGVDEVYAVPRGQRQARVSAARRLVGRLMRPLGLVLAFLIGMAGYAAAAVLLFQIRGLDQPVGGLVWELGTQLGTGLAMALGVGVVLQGLRGKLLATQALGVGGGALVLPTAVQLWPAVFESLTSASWVAKVVSASAPNVPLIQALAALK